MSAVTPEPQRRAVVFDRFGGPEVLRLAHVARPEPGAGELQIDVAAVTVMRTRDATTRAGVGPFSRFVTFPHILGGEHAGVVRAVGPHGDAAMVGRRVAVSSVVPCGVCSFCSAGRDEACQAIAALGTHLPGAYADAVVVPAANIHLLPDDVSFAQGAVMAANGPVAHAQLATAGLSEGQWLAVTGANGALGSTVLAMAAERGVRTVAIVRDADQDGMLRGLGVDHVLGSVSPDLTAALLETTDGHGLDAVVDNLCVADMWSGCLGALAPGGRAVVSGAVGPAIGSVDLRRLYINNQSIVGVRTGNREHTEAFWRSVQSGWRYPMAPIRSYPLEDAATAHADLDAPDKVGHVVLRTDADAAT